MQYVFHAALTFDDIRDGGAPGAPLCGISLFQPASPGTIFQLAALEPMVRSIINAALAKCSGLIALDLYLGQTDRDNHRNVIWGSDPGNIGESNFLFLDFSNSMNFLGNWENEKWQQINPSAPKILIDAIDKTVLSETSERIRTLRDSVVTEIVDRVEEDYLSMENKITIKNGLYGRRSLVADYIKKNYLKHQRGKRCVTNIPF